MSVILEKLGTVIAGLEEQTHEISEYGNVLQRISNVESQIEKTTELTNKSTEQLSGILTDYTDFIHSFDSKVESQNSVLKAMKSDVNKQIAEFSHEFIEKISVMRNESLNAHTDLRHDIERVKKANTKVSESIKQFSEELLAYLASSSKTEEDRHQKLEIILLEQNKNLSRNNKTIIFIGKITTILLSIILFFSFK
jgi:oligoendopeptidase F